jgi:hypothetical protein
MTGMIRTRPSGDPVLTLVCDRCGEALHAVGPPIPEFGMVWGAAEHLGWTGPNRPIGPHYCRECLPSA